MENSINLLKSWLQNHKKLTGFFIFKKENIFWFTGFNGSFGIYLQTQKKQYLITDNRYAERAEKCAKKNNCEFVLFDKNFEKKVGNKITGYFAVEDSVSLAQFKQLKKLFPKIKCTSKKNILEEIRRKKTNTEILKIKTAQSHADKILIHFLQAKLRKDISEKELKFELEYTIRDKGKFDIAFPTVIAFGENSSIPHHESSERKLKKGDNILIDCGTKFEGYCSDMTRNFGFGTLTTEFKNKYQLLKEVQEKTLAKYQAGIKTKELDRYARDLLKKEAKFFTHSLGHGVGLEIHELPRLSQKHNSTLKENDIVTCEPGIYYPGKFGIRIEDLVVIRKEESEILSQTTKELIVF